MAKSKIGSLNYIRTGSSEEQRAALKARRRLLDVAASFTGHSNYQLLIDDFLGRVERRTLEVLDKHVENHVELRRLVADAVEAEISVVLNQLDGEGQQRLSGSKSR